MTKIFTTFIFTVLFSTFAMGQETVPARDSTLAGIALPSGAARVNEGHVPAEITDALDKLVAAGNGKVRSGDREVLAWTEDFKKSNAQGLIKKFTGSLQASGWTYELGGTDGDLAVFTMTRANPEKRALVGFYTYTDEAFVLALSEILLVDAKASAAAAKPAAVANNSSNQSGARVVSLPKNMTYINVMGNDTPAMPKFAALAPKAGKVRGYVKDSSGKPLQGAAIGVRATLLAGAYSGAQGKTDANGYYEFAIPRGVAHYYNAGYAIEYGEGLAAVGLHPADGSVDSFASVDGAVENFVMLTYGITSRANVSDNPRVSSSYYGGSVYVGYYAAEPSDVATYPHYIPENSIMEISFTPDGPLYDGSVGQTIVVKKTAAFDTGFWINNIPIGRYKIAAKLAGGRSLKMSLNRPTGTAFGIFPAETSSSATLHFSPSTAQASMVTQAAGSWDPVSISVERP